MNIYFAISFSRKKATGHAIARCAMLIFRNEVKVAKMISAILHGCLNNIKLKG